MNEADAIKSKVIHKRDEMEVTAFLLPDDGPHPQDEGACTPEDLQAFDQRRWNYVEIIVVVRFRGHEIGRDTLPKVPHGVMGDGHRADALRWSPCVIRTEIHEPGSPLWDASSEAVNAARRWFGALGGVPPLPDSPLGKLTAWANPIRA